MTIPCTREVDELLSSSFLFPPRGTSPWKRPVKEIIFLFHDSVAKWLNKSKWEERRFVEYKEKPLWRRFFLRLIRKNPHPPEYRAARSMLYAYCYQLELLRDTCHCLAGARGIARAKAKHLDHKIVSVEMALSGEMNRLAPA